MSFRDIKARARRDLHEHMRVAALYIERGQPPRPCSVRVQTKFVAVGDQIGTNFHSAEREDVMPRLLFWREEVSFPARGAIVSIALGEAYTVDAALPPDGLTISAHVTQMTAQECVGLPLPETA